MPIQVREIHKYAATVHAHPVYSHIILLYGNNTDGLIGRLYFRRNVTSPPLVNHSGQITNVVLPESQYLSSIDVLRHESPVFLHSADNYATITTLQEPVGEGEEEGI